MNDLAKVFEGEPRTEITTEGGQTTISVAVRHLRPWDAQSADETSILLRLGAAAVAGWITYESMDVTVHAVGLFVGALCGQPFMQKKLRHVGQVTATVRFTEDSIYLQGVRKPPFWQPEENWHRFNRSHEHRFVLYPHDKARAEKDEIDYQLKTKPGRRVTRYYGESWYVALEYLGQRFDVAEVFGKRKADTILDRLTFCDKYMEGLADARKGPSLKPQDEWAGPSGSLPQ